MFIQQLGRELKGRELAIWTGKNEDGTPLEMPEEKRQEYVRLWLARAQKEMIARATQPQKFGEQVRELRRDCGCKGKQNGQRN